jgi:hypothetical protein
MGNLDHWIRAGRPQDEFAPATYLHRVVHDSELCRFARGALRDCALNRATIVRGMEESGQPLAPFAASGHPLPRLEQSGRPLPGLEESGRPLASLERSGRPLSDAEGAAPIRHWRRQGNFSYRARPVFAKGRRGMAARFSPRFRKAAGRISFRPPGLGPPASGFRRQAELP